MKQFSFLGLVAALFFAVPVLGELRDPTRPTYITNETADYVQAMQSRFELSSVLIGEYRRSAVINGQRVMEGDLVGSARVEHIRKSGVTIKVDNTDINLALSVYEIKR